MFKKIKKLIFSSLFSLSIITLNISVLNAEGRVEEIRVNSPNINNLLDDVVPGFGRYFSNYIPRNGKIVMDTKKYLTDEISKDNVYAYRLVDDNERTVSFALVAAKPDWSYVTLRYMFTVPGFGGNGYATQLVRFLQNKIINGGEIYLTATSSSRSFYKDKLGFVGLESVNDKSMMWKRQV